MACTNAEMTVDEICHSEEAVGIDIIKSLQYSSVNHQYCHQSFVQRLRKREFLTPAVLNSAFRRRVFTFKSNFQADLSPLYINSYVE